MGMLSRPSFRPSSRAERTALQPVISAEAAPCRNSGVKFVAPLCGKSATIIPERPKKSNRFCKNPRTHLRPGKKVLLRLQRAVGSGGLRGQTGVVVDELDVGGEAVAAGQVLDLREQERRRGLAVDTGCLGFLDGQLT